MENFKISNTERIVQDKYHDILYAKRPKLPVNRPRMSLINRAKIFSQISLGSNDPLGAVLLLSLVTRYNVRLRLVIPYRLKLQNNHQTIAYAPSNNACAKASYDVSMPCMYYIA